MFFTFSQSICLRKCLCKRIYLNSQNYRCLKETVYCSQPKYGYFCTTGNKNFKRLSLKKYFIFCTARLIVSMNIFVQRVTSNVFISNQYFLNWLTGYLTFQLTDWLEIWRRSSPDVSLLHQPRISKSDVFSIFFFFFYHPKDEKHKENRCLYFKMPFF